MTPADGQGAAASGVAAVRFPGAAANPGSAAFAGTVDAACRGHRSSADGHRSAVSGAIISIRSSANPGTHASSGGGDGSALDFHDSAVGIASRIVFIRDKSCPADACTSVPGNIQSPGSLDNQSCASGNIDSCEVTTGPNRVCSFNGQIHRYAGGDAHICRSGNI